MVDDDDSDLDVERLSGGHSRLAAAVLALVLIGATTLGIAGRMSSSPDVTAPPLEVTPAQSQAIADGASAIPRATPPAIGSASIHCLKVAPGACTRIARAAVQGLPAGLPEPARITVSASLLCSSALDCPQPLLTSTRPLGSAVIEFGDGGPNAWVDIVAARGPGTSARLEAWVVRWVAAPSVPGPATGFGGS